MGNSQGTSLEDVTYLLMGEAQLVLQDSLSVRQNLDFVGKSGESIRQRVREMKIGHALFPFS